MAVKSRDGKEIAETFSQKYLNINNSWSDGSEKEPPTFSEALSSLYERGQWT